MTALLHALTGVGSVVSPRVRSGNRSGNPGGVDSELTHSETSSNYLCTNDGLETGRLTSGGCGDSSAEREFPSDKVYRRDDRGIVGVESFGSQGLASSASTASLDADYADPVPVNSSVSALDRRAPSTTGSTPAHR